MRRLALAFLVLIAYGSLYPFAGWRAPQAPLFSFLLTAPAQLHRADMVQNVLAYIPFGLFVGAWLRPAIGPRAALAAATVAAGLLSLTLECLQQFLPSRDPSSVDLALNIAGAFGGALLTALLQGDVAAGARLHALRRDWLDSGVLPNLGLAALALWALSQTSPLAPSLDLGQLRSGLAQVLRALQRPDTFRLGPALSYACYLAGLGLLVRTLVRKDKPALPPFALLLACVFALKIVVQGRQLSLEALAGAGAALAFLRLGPVPGVRAAWAGMALVAAGFLVSELIPGSGERFAFNWIPLAGQMRNLSGLQNILEIFWPWFAVACFARMLCPADQRRTLAVGGGAGVAVLIFCLELTQQSLPGRFGDITQVMLGWAGWMLPWTFSGPDYATARPPPT